MNNKEKVLNDVINCLKNLNNTIGESITEYHWREFSAIINQIEESFPEYDLIKNHPKSLNNDLSETNDDW